MSYITEFPDFDSELYLLEGYEDNSWHNDICPHVERRIEDGDIEIVYLLWQDYKDPIKRENADADRYVFQIELNGNGIFEYSSNKLKKIKKVMKGVCL